MLVLGFLITWFVAGMLLNIWLTPNQSIAVGVIIALIITAFSATARRTAGDSSAGRTPCPRCHGDGYVVTGRDFDRLYTNKCPKCFGGKYDLEAESAKSRAAFNRYGEELLRQRGEELRKRRKYDS